MMGRKAGWLVAVWAVAAWAGPAAAQRNGLFNSDRRSRGYGPPTSQPAVRAVPVVSATPVASLRSSGEEDPYADSLNPVLAQRSSIAVQLPKPEQIKVHDLVTIIIRETKTSKTDAKMKAEKEWKLDSELSKWFRLNPQDHLVAQTFTPVNPGAQFDFSNEYEGKGKFDRKDSLTTRITAEVIDVKPNGTLVLEAGNRVTVDEEAYIITLTGTCRSKDVSAQNTVLSTQLHGLHVDVQHTGSARDSTRRGWLMRMFDLVRPF